MTVIIVEDEALIAMLFQRELQRHGFLVAGVFSSGEAALSWWQASTRDALVLMDIQLEGELDGLDTVRKIREFGNCSVVFMTGYGNDEMRAKAMELGPLAFMEKPVDPRELLKILEVHAKHSSVL